jgi:hypothetical protein
LLFSKLLIAICHFILILCVCAVGALIQRHSQFPSAAGQRAIDSSPLEKKTLTPNCVRRRRRDFKAMHAQGTTAAAALYANHPKNVSVAAPKFSPEIALIGNHCSSIFPVNKVACQNFGLFRFLGFLNL